MCCWVQHGCSLWPISAVTSTTNGLAATVTSSFRSTLLGQFNLPKCVSRKHELYVSCVFPWRTSLASTDVSDTYPPVLPFTGAISLAIVKVTKSSALEKIRVSSKSAHHARQAGRFQRLGLVRTLMKQL